MIDCHCLHSALKYKTHDTSTSVFLNLYLWLLNSKLPRNTRHVTWWGKGINLKVTSCTDINFAQCRRSGRQKKWAYKCFCSFVFCFFSTLGFFMFVFCMFAFLLFWALFRQVGQCAITGGYSACKCFSPPVWACKCNQIVCAKVVSVMRAKNIPHAKCAPEPLLTR